MIRGQLHLGSGKFTEVKKQKKRTNMITIRVNLTKSMKSTVIKNNHAQKI